MTSHKKMLWLITGVFLSAQIILLLGLIAKGEVDFIRSAALTTCLWVIFTAVENKYGIYLHNTIRMLVVIALFADGFGGYYLNLYADSVVFDKVLHVFGSYAITLLLYSLVVQLLRNPAPPVFKCILAVFLGVGTGAMYEVMEFLTDRFSQPSLPSQPSLLDTDLDLIGNIIGAVTAGIHVAFRNVVNRYF